MNGQKRTSPFGRHPFFRWWSRHIAQSVDRKEVVARVYEDAGWSGHYVFMTLMSAGIAVLGLLLSSPAVVIGAMLISPLMGPIIGLGFALAVFDAVEIRRTISAMALGVALAIGFSAFVVMLSPLQTVTAEIAARTRPNLFDLLVALFSGLAGTYAMIRGRQGAIVGVAIATALMPPLAVIGFGLAIANSTVFWGATLLFLTNLMTIALAAAILARIYGFAANLSPRQSGLQVTLVLATFLALGVPLALALKQIAWETIASRQVRDALAGHFGDQSRLSDVAVDYDSEPISVHATVLTPQFRRGAEGEIARQLQLQLLNPVEVTIDQFRVDAEEAAEAAEIAVVRSGGAERARDRLAQRLALIAGVLPDQVLVDGVNRRAVVRASRLPGANLATYHTLEGRIAAAEEGWSVALVPPVLPLGDIGFEEGAPDDEGRLSLRTAIWAGQRLRLPIAVSGDSEDSALIVEALTEAGVEARLNPGGGGDGVSLRWATAQAPED